MEQLASTWTCHLLHPSVRLHMTLYPAAQVISTIQPTDYMMKIDLRSVFVSNLHRSRTSQILWDLLLNEYLCINIQWTIPWPLLWSSTLPKRWLEYFTNALMSQWLPAWMTGSSRVLSYQPQTWSTPLRTWASPSMKPNLYFEKQLLSHTWDFKLTSCICTLNLQPDVFIIYWKCWLSFCRLHPKIFDVSQDTQYGSRGVLVGHLLLQRISSNGPHTGTDALTRKATPHAGSTTVGTTLHGRDSCFHLVLLWSLWWQLAQHFQQPRPTVVTTMAAALTGLFWASQQYQQMVAFTMHADRTVAFYTLRTVKDFNLRSSELLQRLYRTWVKVHRGHSLMVWWVPSDASLVEPLS
jgi:hypothetical protein